MYHTLRTLYDWWEKNKKENAEQFYKKYPDSLLKAYCYDADAMEHKINLNRGYNSLKWCFYTLRDCIPEAELIHLFNEVIMLAYMLGEDKLYNNILSLVVREYYLNILKNNNVDLSEFPIIDWKGFKILINESDKNITNYVFKKKKADAIIFYNSKIKSAGIVVDQKNDIHQWFDMPNIFVELMRRNEAWTIIGKNLIICGGYKHPEKQTSITLSELIEIVKRNVTEKPSDNSVKAI